MTETMLAIGAFLLVLTLFVAFQWWAKKSRRLPASQAKALWKSFATAESQPDLHRRVLDAAKVVESTLKAKGYQGSFADMLRTAGPAIPGVQSVWDGLKLRNRIAHESDVSVDARTADRAVAAFERALKVFLGSRSA